MTLLSSGSLQFSVSPGSTLEFRKIILEFTHWHVRIMSMILQTFQYTACIIIIFLQPNIMDINLQKEGRYNYKIKCRKTIITALLCFCLCFTSTFAQVLPSMATYAKVNVQNITCTRRMFCYCTNLTSLDLSNFNTANVTSTGYIFSGCSSLATLDLSNFNINKEAYIAITPYFANLNFLEKLSFLQILIKNMAFLLLMAIIGLMIIQKLLLKQLKMWQGRLFILGSKMMNLLL